MVQLFKNIQENRLRAGWRIAIFLVLFFTFNTAVFAIKPLFGAIAKREFISSYSLLIVFILTISALMSSVITRRLVDKKPWKTLGLCWSLNSLKDLMFGFILSALMAASFFGVLLAFNLTSFQGINWDIANANTSSFISYMKVLSLGSLLLLLLEHILVGFWEELIFRGYILQNMMEGLGSKIAIVISCILYGIIHASNPNAGVLSTIIIVLFGFLRIYGFLTTKQLWLSIGMHIGWNFFQAPIFGFAASGHTKARLINHQLDGPDWLTGGEFGPEASVLIIPIIILALWFMRLWANSTS